MMLRSPARPTAVEPTPPPPSPSKALPTRAPVVASQVCIFQSELGIDVPALHWLNTTGQGPRRHRIGKQNCYRRGEVEEWLATRVVTT
jgi:hypothetical protein